MKKSSEIQPTLHANFKTAVLLSTKTDIIRVQFGETTSTIKALQQDEILLVSEIVSNKQKFAVTAVCSKSKNAALETVIVYFPLISWKHKLY